MEIWKWVFVGILWYAAFVLRIGAVELGRSQPTERISGGIFFFLFSFLVCNSVLCSGLSCLMLFGLYMVFAVD